MLHHGLYEQVINTALTSELVRIPEACKAVAPIEKAEASNADLSRPESSIAQSSLFTDATHEPQLYAELKKEIAYAEYYLASGSSHPREIFEEDK